MQSSVSTPTPVTPGTPSYQVLTPGTPCTPSGTSRLLSVNPSDAANSPAVTPTFDAVGSFYLKSKEEEEGFVRVSKREKARAKRQQKLASRIKELPHTPDVLTKFTKLSITPPKNTDEIPAAIIALQDNLQRFNVLSLSKIKEKEENQRETDTGTHTTKCTRPSSLPINGNNIFTPTISISTAVSPSASISTHKSEKPAVLKQEIPSPAIPSLGLQALCLNPLPYNVASSPTSWAATVVGNQIESKATTSTSQVQDNANHLYNGIHVLNSVSSPQCNTTIKAIQSKTCNDIIATGNNESFFSLPISYPNSLVELNNNHGRSYASVVAKIKAGAVDL